MINLMNSNNFAGGANYVLERISNHGRSCGGHNQQRLSRSFAENGQNSSEKAHVSEQCLTSSQPKRHSATERKNGLTESRTTLCVRPCHAVPLVYIPAVVIARLVKEALEPLGGHPSKNIAIFGDRIHKNGKSNLLATRQTEEDTFIVQSALSFFCHSLCIVWTSGVVIAFVSTYVVQVYVLYVTLWYETDTVNRVSGDEAKVL